MTDQPNEQDRHEAPDAATQGARHDEVHASATDPTLTQGEKSWSIRTFGPMVPAEDNQPS